MTKNGAKFSFSDASSPINNNDVFDKATDLLKARAGRYLYDPAS